MEMRRVERLPPRQPRERVNRVKSRANRVTSFDLQASGAPYACQCRARKTFHSPFAPSKPAPTEKSGPGSGPPDVDAVAHVLLHAAGQIHVPGGEDQLSRGVLDTYSLHVDVRAHIAGRVVKHADRRVRRR
jgi:hypothetical protein